MDDSARDKTAIRHKAWLMEKKYINCKSSLERLHSSSECQRQALNIQRRRPALWSIKLFFLSECKNNVK